METHHQQTAATTMGVAEDETPSSLTPHPSSNNPNQEGESAHLRFTVMKTLGRKPERRGLARISLNYSVERRRAYKYRATYSPSPFYHSFFFFILSTERISGPSRTRARRGQKSRCRGEGYGRIGRSAPACTQVQRSRAA